MRENVPIIVHLETRHKSALATLHLRYLPTPFSGQPGAKLLELYYNSLSVAEQVIGLVAVLDEIPVGYACAVRDAREVQRRLLRQAPLSIGFWVLIQILYRPQVWLALGRRLTVSTTQTSNWQRPDSFKDWYTYRPVVVDEPYRKYRVADLLTEHLLNEASQRKIPGILSIVEKSNFRSFRHFLRHGFQEVWGNEQSIVLGRELRLL